MVTFPNTNSPAVSEAHRVGPAQPRAHWELSPPTVPRALGLRLVWEQQVDGLV